MAAPTGTATTLTTGAGNREDLSEVLERVAPDQAIFYSNIGSAQKAKAVYTDWQTEDLAAPTLDNEHLEGDDVNEYQSTDTVRVGNHTQIFRKSIAASETQEVVDKAGRKSELARQRVLRSIENKRDIELALLSNRASRAQSGSNPRRLGGILSWIETNTNRGTGGASGGFENTVTSAATNGTQRPFTEALLKDVMQKMFDSSGQTNDRQLYMSSSHKMNFSSFTGISEHRTAVSGKSQAIIHGAAEAYMSDFGFLIALPVAYGLTRDVLIIDPKYLGVSTLRPMSEKKLAVTGDNKKRMIICEKTLCVKNEKALGVIADLS